jgi:ferredoxin
MREEVIGMKVEVDRALCVAHGQCEYAAPDVFTINDDGDLELDENPPESEWPNVLRAISVCPVRALKSVG